MKESPCVVDIAKTAEEMMKYYDIGEQRTLNENARMFTLWNMYGEG